MGGERYEFDPPQPTITRRRLLGTMALTTLIALEIALHENESTRLQINEITAEVKAILADVALLNGNDQLETVPTHQDDMVDAARWIPPEH